VGDTTAGDSRVASKDCRAVNGAYELSGIVLVVDIIWADGAFITTNPDRSRCATSRSAVIRAMMSSTWWTRLRPSYRSAKDSVSAISSGVAGRSSGVLVMPNRSDVTGT
jgi:hypothetical protein